MRRKWQSKIGRLRGFPGGSDGKDRRHRFSPRVGKSPWRKDWLPTPVFLPGEFHEQRSLAGYTHGVTKSWTRLSNTFTFRFQDSLPISRSLT